MSSKEKKKKSEKSDKKKKKSKSKSKSKDDTPEESEVGDGPSVLRSGEVVGGQPQVEDGHAALQPNELPRTKIHNPKAYAEQIQSLSPLNVHGWICVDGDCRIVATRRLKPTSAPITEPTEPGSPVKVPASPKKAPASPQKSPGSPTKSPTKSPRKSSKAAAPLLVDEKRYFARAVDCPVCLEGRGKLHCGRCQSIMYCSPECQKRHWKEGHDEACQPNPALYEYRVSINEFLTTVPPTAGTVGYEFILIKPVPNALEGGIKDICEQVLESADDLLLNIPGFGHDQIQSLWAASNQKTSEVCATIREKLGFTSGAYGVELVEGYRVAEDIFINWVLCDDCFVNPEQSPGLEPSYYGGAIFPSVVRGEPPNNVVRGNLVIFRTVLRNKKRRKNDNPDILSALTVALSDDSDLAYDYEIYPISKLEVAHMLFERRRAIDNKMYTRRMWRHITRKKECAVEAEKKFGHLFSK